MEERRLELTVEERLEQLRGALAQPLSNEDGEDDGKEDSFREEVLANQGLILIEALEECKRLEEQEQRYREEIEQLSSERSEVHSKLASLNLRLKAFQYRSKSLSQDDTFFRGSTLQSKLLVNNLEPAKVVEAVKEAARSQAGFEEDARPEDRLQHDGNGTSSREMDKAYLKSFEYGKDKMVVRGSHGIKDKRTSIISILTKGSIIDSL